MPTSFVYEKESVGRAFGAVFTNFFFPVNGRYSCKNYRVDVLDYSRIRGVFNLVIGVSLDVAVLTSICWVDCFHINTHNCRSF